MPATVTIATPDGGDDDDQPDSTISDYYSVEFRHSSGFDRGIPNHAVVVHLRGGDGFPYWVDDAGGNGAMGAGETFVDADENAYIAINRIDASSFQATVTLGSCRIPTAITYGGDTTGAFGDTVTLSAGLAVDNPTGAPVPFAPVTLGIGGQSCAATTDAAGAASCTVTLTQNPGTYAVTASYTDTDTYRAATSFATFEITRRATTTAVTSPTNPSVIGQPVTLTATVAAASGPGTPTGTVTFHDGLVAIGSATVGADGKATLTTAALAVGSHPITAAYGGDTRSTPSTSASLTQVVDKGRTATTLTSSLAAPVYTQPITFTATVAPVAPAAGQPSGTVTFTDGGATLGVVPVDAAGRAALTTAALHAGTHSIAATYSGDGNFLASARGLTQVVAQAATHLEVAPPVIHIDLHDLVWVEMSARLTVVATGVPVAGEPVVMMAKSKVLCSGVTSADGTATCRRHLIGTLAVVLNGGYTAVFGGNADLLSTSARSPR